MPELPKLNAKECEKILFQNGFILDRQKGSHKIYKNNIHRMVIPFHTNKTLHPKIIKQMFEVIENTKS